MLQAAQEAPMVRSEHKIFIQLLQLLQFYKSARLHTHDIRKEINSITYG